MHLCPCSSQIFPAAHMPFFLPRRHADAFCGTRYSSINPVPCIRRPDLFDFSWQFPLHLFFRLFLVNNLYHATRFPFRIRLRIRAIRAHGFTAFSPGNRTTSLLHILKYYGLVRKMFRQLSVSSGKTFPGITKAAGKLQSPAALYLHFSLILFYKRLYFLVDALCIQSIP